MRIPSAVKNDKAARLETRPGAHAAKKLITAVASSAGRVERLSKHATGTSLCLALGYVVLSSAYIYLSGRIAAKTAWSIAQLRIFELLKGLTFVIITGAAYFWFAAFLLKRIFRQQQHLRLIFEGVSDCLFLLQAKAGEDYRFLCVNDAFLKVTGFTRKQVVGKRIEDVLPEASIERVRSKLEEAIRERKTVSWQGTAVYPAGQRTGDVALTPLLDKGSSIIQLAGVARDITERKQAEDDVRQLSGLLLRSQDEERERIGRELHDSTGQELAAVSMNLGLVQQRSTGRDITVDNLLADSQAILENCQRELRTLTYQLHPPVLDEVSLPCAVQEYADGFAKRSGIKVTLDASLTLGRLPADTERALFRVVQECLGNIHRHSGSKVAAIRISRNGTKVTLDVADQGQGMSLHRDGTALKAGVGLAGMRERLRQLGGTLEIESSRQGTTVRATVPGETGTEEGHGNPDCR